MSDDRLQIVLLIAAWFGCGLPVALMAISVPLNDRKLSKMNAETDAEAWAFQKAMFERVNAAFSGWE